LWRKVDPVPEFATNVEDRTGRIPGLVLEEPGWIASISVEDDREVAREGLHGDDVLRGP
jgi:hypothetical protein